MPDIGCADITDDRYLLGRSWINYIGANKPSITPPPLVFIRSHWHRMNELVNYRLSLSFHVVQSRFSQFLFSVFLKPEVL